MHGHPQPAPLFVQLHSHDYLIRVSSRALHRIPFQHICTVRDPAPRDGHALHARGTKRTGYTEWQAAWQGKVLSLGWDWIEHGPRCVLRSDSVAPRSNLRLVDARGYDFRPDDEIHYLCHRIDTLPWRPAVAGAREDEPGLPANMGRFAH